MRVHHFCGYFSDYAVTVTGIPRPRDPPFWESYMFCWAVKSGEYHRDFYILKSDGRLNITKDNFDRVRPTFGEWAAKVIATFPQNPLHLVPVPNTEALANATTYRTLKLVQEAFKGTDYDGSALDGLRWNKTRQKAHEGGSRKREDLLPLLDAKPGVKGKNIVLIDEIVTTGGNLLACQDRLIAAGATVVGAVTCGRSVYDVNDPPFGARSFDLTEQLQDYRPAGAALRA
jgi:predicted amidophosphoribosyltransferase